MGKKRIASKSGGAIGGAELRRRALARLPKKKLAHAVLNITATYNNTKVNLADVEGGVLAWSSTGALGFKGARKGTPYAASKVAEVLAEKAEAIGVKSISVVVKGVGAGRESAIRVFSSRGFDIQRIVDATPVPHNGPRSPKARRV